MGYNNSSAESGYSTMKLLLLIFLHWSKTSSCFWCPPCCHQQIQGQYDEDCLSCPQLVTPTSCVSGEVTLDNCLCCKVCALPVGGVCGGWQYAGAHTQCAQGLRCTYKPGETQSDFNTGVCTQK